MRNCLHAVVFFVLIVGGSRIPAATVTLEATTDLWIREIDKDTCYENDLVSVWGANTYAWDEFEEARYGAVAFDLRGVDGRIVAAYIELYAMSEGTPVTPIHNGTAFSQSASLLSPPVIGGLTWNGLAAYSEDPLDSLGGYDLPADSPTGRYYASEAASADDIAKLEAFRTSTGSVAILLKPISPAGAREWGDREAAGLPPRLVIEFLSIPGDLNGDGFVGSSDLDIVRGNWETVVEPGCLACGDPSGDGIVGSADLDMIRANWQREVATVPEPTILGYLMVIGIVSALQRGPRVS